MESVYNLSHTQHVLPSLLGISHTTSKEHYSTLDFAYDQDMIPFIQADYNLSWKQTNIGIVSLAQASLYLVLKHSTLSKHSNSLITLLYIDESIPK